MRTAREQLITLIEEHRDELVVRVCNRLQKFSYTHYETICFEQHQEREELFLVVILQHLREGGSDVMTRYLEDLVDQRTSEGYSLKEVEEAFDIVEDALWQVLSRYWPLEQSLIEGLSILRKIFQEIKNYLGQLFLEDAISAQKFDSIRRKFDEYRNEMNRQSKCSCPPQSERDSPPSKD